jgi:ABC-type antimicrobial peptide transport system permease subunit
MNNTTANTTAAAIEESGILDTLMDSPELLLATGIIAGLGGYITYTQPKVKALIMPYLVKYDTEIMMHLEKNLSKAQLKAYEKLDEQVKKQVNNKVLQDVIMSAWDEKDDMMADAVKQKVKSALEENK